MTGALRRGDDGVKPEGAGVEAPGFTQESPIRNFTDSSPLQNSSFKNRP
jgi:hypothetical protein